MKKYDVLEGFVIGVEPIEDEDGKVTAKRLVAIKGKTESLTDKQVKNMNLIKRNKVKLHVPKKTTKKTTKKTEETPPVE